MPHNPYHYEDHKITNWPLIILITIAAIILIGIVAYFIINKPFSKGTVGNLDDETRGEIDNLFNNTSQYDCSSDTYNCDDFTTQAEAQTVFDVCGPGDVHRLDADGNERACEGLP